MCTIVVTKARKRATIFWNFCDFRRTSKGHNEFVSSQFSANLSGQHHLYKFGHHHSIFFIAHCIFQYVGTSEHIEQIILSWAIIESLSSLIYCYVAFSSKRASKEHFPTFNFLWVKSHHKLHAHSTASRSKDDYVATTVPYLLKQPRGSELKGLIQKWEGHLEGFTGVVSW